MTPRQVRLHVAAIVREQNLQRRLRLVDDRLANADDKSFNAHLRKLTPKI